MEEYALANKISKESAFAWWNPHALKKRDFSIMKVRQSKFKDNKYGIKIPKNIMEAYTFDRGQGNFFWRNAIRREMKCKSPACYVLNEGVTSPPQYKFVGFHLVLDIKIDFSRKARLVSDGCKTHYPVTSTFAGVVF